jgi:hypothetical protein
MPYDGQAQAYFRAIARLAASHHYPARPGETPLEYGSRVRNRFLFRNGSIGVGGLAEIYYKAKYSTDSVTETEAAAMRESYFDMLGQVRDARKRRGFFYLRYVKRATVI